MNLFTFNNYEEFGLFLKINSADYLMAVSPEEQALFNEFIQIYEHSKGGCGCNIKQRKRAAADKYPIFVNSFFLRPVGHPEYPAPNEAMITLTKTILNCDAILFKANQTDETGFLNI